MWPLKPTSPPPVPQRLRDMLQAHPELIERLQESLNRVITNPVKSQPPFEVAIWELEGTIEGFVEEARKELEAAEASGEPAAIEQARSKLSLMRSAGFKGRWLGDEAFADYFQALGTASP